MSLSHDYISTVFNRTANSILFSKDSKFGELVNLYLSTGCTTYLYFGYAVKYFRISTYWVLGKKIYLCGAANIFHSLCAHRTAVWGALTQNLYNHDYAAVSTASGVGDKMINADETKQIVIQLIVLLRVCLTIIDDIYLTNICDVPIKQM